MAHPAPTSFMKEEDMLPMGLLKTHDPVPVETHGLGQFGTYAPVVNIMCASPPARQTSGAAGHDLKAQQSVRIPARGSASVPTGVSLALPPGHYARIAGRSSLAFKHRVTAFEGTIDSDYRGHVQVLLFNHSDTPYDVQVGDRVAQMVIQTYVAPVWNRVGSLSASRRGAGGFGSSGR